MTSTVENHFRAYLGDPLRAETLDRSVGLYRYERPEFVTFATVGLSTLPIAAVVPQELVCSVERSQDGAAAFLVRSMFEMILEADRGLVNDQVVPSDQPILEGTNITGLLATSHPFLDDEFNVIRANSDETVVEIMTLIPITTSETSLSRTRGVDALIDHLENAEPPLLNVARSN